MRRGASEGVVIAIIIFLVVFIVVWLIYQALFSETKTAFTEKECQASLQLTQAVDRRQPVCYVKVTNPVPLKCSRNFLTITPDKVLSNAKDVTYLYSPKCPTAFAGGGGGFGGAGASGSWEGATPAPAAGTASGACRPHNAVAEEMRACWRTFFEGELVVLQQVEENSAKFWTPTGDARACFVCAEITLDAPDIDNFTEYLKSQQMTRRDKAPAELTYYEFLTNENAWCDKKLTSEDAPTCFEAIGKGVKASWWRSLLPHGVVDLARPDVRPVKLESGKRYAVVFVRTGISTCTERTVETADVTNTVQLVPVDQVRAVCDTVMV